MEPVLSGNPWGPVNPVKPVILSTLTFLLVASLPVPATARAGCHPSTGDAVAAGFDVQKIADGVFAAIRREPPGIFVDANSVFIINAEDVVVVDANLTPGSARDCLAALRKLTDKPVSHVVNTHWHQDHVVGDQVYRDAFPGVEIVASSKARTTLAAKSDETRKLYLTAGPEYSTSLRSAVEKETSFLGTPMTPDEDASYLAAAGLIDRYVAEAPEMRTTLPTLTVDDRMVLHRGDRTIEIRSLGRGHTDNDLIVYLPKEGVVAAGDLVVAPVPLTGDQSFIGDWAGTLERLLALKPAVIVPGHGPVLRDVSYVKLMIELLSSMSSQTKAAVAKGETLEQARKSIDLGAFRKRLCGDSRSLLLIVENYVNGAGIAKAFAEASTRE